MLTPASIGHLLAPEPGGAARGGVRGNPASRWTGGLTPGAQEVAQEVAVVHLITICVDLTIALFSSTMMRGIRSTKPGAHRRSPPRLRRAVVAVGDVAGDGQAETAAAHVEAAGVLQAGEPLEDALTVGQGESRGRRP